MRQQAKGHAADHQIHYWCAARTLACDTYQNLTLSAMLAFGLGILLRVFVSRLEIVFGVGLLVFVAGIFLLRADAKKRIKRAGEQARTSGKFPKLPDIGS